MLTGSFRRGQANCDYKYITTTDAPATARITPVTSRWTEGRRGFIDRPARSIFGDPYLVAPDWLLRAEAHAHRIAASEIATCFILPATIRQSVTRNPEHALLGLNYDKGMTGLEAHDDMAPKGANLARSD